MPADFHAKDMIADVRLVAIEGVFEVIVMLTFALKLRRFFDEDFWPSPRFN